MNAGKSTLSQRLAGFVAETSGETLPAAVVHKAKRHILDTLGVSLGGATAVEARSVRALMSLGSKGEIRAWGTSQSFNARDAAFVNGVAAHALELDDAGGCDHSGAVVLPAAFAALACTDRAVSGREFLTAVVLGYDVGRRVLEACGGYSPHNNYGWHSTMTCGAFGAAAASARLLGLDAIQTAAALGHAGSFSGGLWGFIHDASQTKRMHTGRAAEGGLLAALLARQGVSGPTQIFEDVWGGFFNAFARETQQPEALLADIGVVWKLMRCSIKPHAACRSTHAAIDATLELLQGRAADLDKLTGVHVSLSAFVNQMCGGRDLNTLASAQMSLPYAIATALVNGQAGIGAYLDAQRHDPRIAAAMRRITLEIDPAMSDLDEPVITLAISDTEPRSRRVDIPLGDPRNPVSDAALVAKFRALAGMTIPEASVDALETALLDLDTLADVRTLTQWLGGDADARPVVR
ncbi:2-methylcitrate dehydratase [Burkholderia sp. PAMC 28687]|jgi:2-methylcitrate dehydratase PrpD|uniref:Immune-responsive protein 1 n=1 Tax=Caballeronia sordidicola TaxID=196367 RepID=A0A242MKX2_CABSO|nr:MULTISPECIES: MmgE/PrpD family protein [Burkholderiaceae]AMM13970.1 2-methylcitrate dehydratase [Burkholderia sp. PAMC 28687]OTP71957.1 Immune-responsive protein 1 [Caballeronia sordidicola]